MKKTKFFVLLIVIFAIVSLLTYLNYDKLKDFFSNRQWEIADSIGKIEVENYIETYGTDSNFFIINRSGIQGYSDTMKKTLSKSFSYKDVVTASAEDYSIVAEKNATNLFVTNKNDVVWESNISNAAILGVTINKNGYSAVIYSQAGYKSLIKVYSNKGEELFTSYLASTYAIDIAISNDNKTLAIAEIDTNGVSLTSDVKLVDIQTASEKSIKKYDLLKGELISDIEYDVNNHLVVLTDMNVQVLKYNKLNTFIDFKEENIFIADIISGKSLVAVRLEEKSLFNVECSVCIYNLNDVGEVKNYKIDETPNKIKTCGDIIAIDTGSKVIFLNQSGMFVKKCEYNGQLKDVVLFDRGNTAVLLFREKADFIKVGGI